MIGYSSTISLNPILSSYNSNVMVLLIHLDIIKAVGFFLFFCRKCIKDFTLLFYSFVTKICACSLKL